MVQLTIYNESNSKMTGRSRTGMVQSKFATLEEAITRGQNSGRYYEVFDAKTGRMIDWDEVNIKIEDDWYYDESELIWKKSSKEESSDQGEDSIFSRFFNFNSDNYLSQLSY